MTFGKHAQILKVVQIFLIPIPIIPLAHCTYIYSMCGVNLFLHHFITVCLQNNRYVHVSIAKLVQVCSG